jgi:septal ring factor EnvC (AmiA/AmiB activator)
MSNHGESSTEENYVDREDLESIKDRVEYLHSEAKQFRSETSNTMHAMDKRLERLQYEDERINDRLNSGAKAFSEVENQIKDVTSKINMPWYKMAALIAPAVIAIATAVYSVTWTLAHVPTGEKFEQMQHDVYEIGAQQRILDGKLDLLLRKTP